MDRIGAELAEAIERHLAEYGVRVLGGLSALNSTFPEQLDLEIDGQPVTTTALYLPHLSATAALQAWAMTDTDSPLLVVGPRLHPSSAETLRARGLWYIDGAGNAYLRHQGGLLIDVRGRRPAVSVQHDTLNEGLHGDGPRNPFTPKRAQVVCVLLAAPELVEAPLRDIAQSAGVSVGMAKETMDTLRITGFLEHLGSRRRLVRAGELLDLWAAAYPGGLGRANRIFVASGDIHAWSAPEGLQVAVSGEQAVPGDIRNPESLVLYVHTADNGLPTDLLIHNRWHRDPHGSIVIRNLFWRHLPDQQSGLAPAALIYADLLASREPRQLEVGHHMRRQDDRLARL
ncbi:type IV toxin-antitoxin system AbiEi family antitoxin [Mycobacterium talmoniae]|uniref:Uncharacterized protein n=1 Tax=Mycobacterium talmoniae TaxID=1858794 RepID=A0A1S1NBJ3_9MYCO|nr:MULTISPECIES: type IV toxin-antitoxin system AbiEi family antitoxin [Mycobacterium]OHU97081.1 hypothetical protein BKN37_22255 [Mycobacterium talmoniae]PQM49215.1 hypothetical protein C1Y40_00570 [Mycobacterium talmoniae]TDH57273.1 hypothetical protein E2F47_02185 [Mycobacterium eburneum]